MLLMKIVQQKKNTVVSGLKFYEKQRLKNVQQLVMSGIIGGKDFLES